MNEFKKMNSSLKKNRLDSKVTLIYANGRDYDQKCKQKIHQKYALLLNVFIELMILNYFNKIKTK